MLVSGEFDPGRCPMLGYTDHKACDSCGLKMCRLVEAIKALEHDKAIINEGYT